MELDSLSGRVDEKYIEILRRKGINLDDLILMSDSELSKELGVDREVAREILKEVSSLLLKPLTADKLLEEESRLRTGMKGLDELLGGGLRIRTITGIYGPPASGKTQFCIYMAVRSLMNEEKGGISSERAIFIDTEGTFDPGRASVFLRQNNLSEGDLSRIDVLRVNNIIQLKEALDIAMGYVRSGTSKLVCLDSISYPFRQYGGLKGLRERQEDLQEVLVSLRRIADRGSVVIMTMHAIKWGRDLYSKGGFVLSHTPHNMLCFRKVRGKVIVTLEDSSYLPPGQAAFIIREDGIFEL
jgi:RecA/RadA recombinase